MGDRIIDGLTVREWGNPGQTGILLWPGLGSSGAYFESLASDFPWRGVAVDPPGSGGSAPLHPCTLDRLVGLARDVAEARACHAVIAHSLGAYVAIGLAANPPAGFRAAVLIDGGFLAPEDYVELGMPVTSGRGELVAWMEANAPHFPDWDTAFAQLATMIGGEVTLALEAYVRDVFWQVDGEVRQRGRADQMADLLLGVVDHDTRAWVEAIKVPTLLIACGEAAGHRASKERAWTRLAQASALIELQVVEGWSHNPILQDPKRFSRLIVDWLAARV